jgi:hypothetical protein
VEDLLEGNFLGSIVARGIAQAELAVGALPPGEEGPIGSHGEGEVTATGDGDDGAVGEEDGLEGGGFVFSPQLAVGVAPAGVEDAIEEDQGVVPPCGDAGELSKGDPRWLNFNEDFPLESGEAAVIIVSPAP